MSKSRTHSNHGLFSLVVALVVSLSYLTSCSASESPTPVAKPTSTTVVEEKVETAKVVKETVKVEPKAESVTQQEAPNTPMVNKSATFNEGTDFITKFPNETPTKPVLVEFFSYMCPHCYNFEGTVTRWKKQKPDSVELIKIPVAFGRGRWRLAAKSYYIAEELNIADKWSPVMFRRIHVEKKPPSNEADLEKLFATLGITSKEFKSAASSFNVDSKMRKADFLAKKYQVSGVPYFLINYKYEVGKASYESETSLFSLFNNLPAKDF